MGRFLLGLAITAGSVALLISLIDWSTTLVALEAANPLFIAGAVASLVISLAAKTYRWRVLLPADSGVTTPRLFRILHISFLLNNVLPARLGDVARVAMTSRQPGLRVGHVVSSLLTERVSDMVTLLMCFVLVSVFLPVPDQYRSWLATTWWVLAAFVGAALVCAVFHRWAWRSLQRIPLPSRLPRPDRIAAEARSFAEGLRQLLVRRNVARVWGTSLFAWACAFAINFFLLKALHIDAPPAVAVLVTCTTNLAMLIPSSPGYIGVFHLAATLSLVPFNVDEARALSFAIVAHLVNVLPVSLLGALFLVAGRESVSLDWRGWRKKPAAAQVP